MDEQLLMSAKIIVTRKKLPVNENELIICFSELLSSFLPSYESDLEQPIQQLDRREG